MIYLFYGSDELSRSEYVDFLLSRLQEPTDLDIIRLEPSNLTFAQLRQTCDAHPFLIDRRIVIIDGLLEKITKRGPKDFVQQLTEYIPRLPDYTRLFLRENEIDKRTTLWKTLEKMSTEKPPHLFLKEFTLPAEQEIPAWVQTRAQKRGGKIERDAAALLATFIGNNLRLLDQEIMKLVTYALNRPVTVKEIHALVPYVQEASVWEMIDALGVKDAKKALMIAYHILTDDPGKAIFLHSMITRQIRMMLQVAELTNLGQKAAEIQKKLGMSSFVYKKVADQIHHFTIERLEKAYDHLLEADVAMKTGADQTLTLNILIAELASRRAN